MTKTLAQAAALALSAVMTLAIVAGVNGIAATQYAAADRLAMAAGAQTDVALQRVIVIGHRANT